ncbi:MAG: DNA polymerase-3 subunit epsilon [Myxococcota bacterium]|jgi:DNA polymerase-3 subunit epsilon
MNSANWFDCDLAVVDVETTGLDPSKDRVIEVGIVHMRAGKTIEQYGRLIDPGREIPEVVVGITGITQDMVDGQPKFEDLAREIHARLEGKVLVAYNLSFDSAFIRAELERVGLKLPEGPALDPLVFARELQKNDGSKKLGAVAERMGIVLEEAHRAVNDAQVAGDVLYAFGEQLPPRLEDLTILQKQWSAQQEQLMAARRRMRGQEVDEDALPTATVALTTDDGIVLGPAYIYGSDPDPLRFFYSQLPDSSTARRS